MPVLPLVLFLTLTAGTDRTVPPGCREDHQTCREDCTIDYGSGTQKYKQLNQCIGQCDRERDACTTRFYSLRDTTKDLPTTRDTSAPEPEQFADPHKRGASEDSERRGVYRTTEPAAPAEETLPAKDNKDDPAPPPEAEEPPPAPEPTPAPAAKAPPKAAPAEEKKAPPARARGKQEEIRAFDDEDPAQEGAAPPPTGSKPAEPAKKKRPVK